MTDECGLNDDEYSFLDPRYLERIGKKLRNATIEECARKMEAIRAYGFDRGERIDAAAAIRALKEKP